MRPTTIYSLSTELGANTIDPDKLNCRVRNGNGCCLIGNIISLIPTLLKSRYTLLKNKSGYKGIIIGREQQFLCVPRLESFSPLSRRVINFLPTPLVIISDNFRKAQVFHLLSFGLKNTAKPHDLLVQLS